MSAPSPTAAPPAAPASAPAAVDPETLSPEEAAQRHRAILRALTGLLLGMFVSMIGNTVVSSSLPVIVHDLNGSQASFTWVVTAMLLTTAISTPIWGKLADLFDRKLLYQLAIVIFVVATAIAGLSQDPSMLITMRAVQGIGAGGLAALSQVIMADIISPRERGRYMGLFGAVMAVATVGGPLLGGVVTDLWGWRWNFFIALPVAVVALILVQSTLHLPVHPPRRVSIDYLGIVLLSVSVSLLLIWVTNAGKDYAWFSPTTAWMVGGGLAAAALFVLVELRSREPLIPLGLFRDRTFTLSVVASIATGLAMFGSSVFLSQYMQLARGATPTQAGLMTIPMVAGLLISSVAVGGLITKTGRWKPYVIAGSVLLVAGTGLLATLEYDTNFWLVSLYMVLLGAGVGMTMQNLVLVVQNTTAPERIGVASSAVTFFRTIGGTAGVSVMGAALATRVTDGIAERQGALAAALGSLGPAAPEWAATLRSGAIPQVSAMPEPLRIIIEDVYAQGISHAFLYAVPFAIISVVAVLFLPNVSLNRMTAAERRTAGETNLASGTTVEDGYESFTGSLPVAGSVAGAGAGAASAATPREAGSHSTTTAAGGRGVRSRRVRTDWLVPGGLLAAGAAAISIGLRRRGGRRG